MTSSEFVIWLKGFTEGVHDFNITPKQWDLLKERLEEVNDRPVIGTVSIPSIWTSTSGSGTTFTVTSGSSYSPSTVTYLYPNGTNVSYTNSNLGIKDTSPSDILDVNDKTLLND